MIDQIKWKFGRHQWRGQSDLTSMPDDGPNTAVMPKPNNAAATAHTAVRLISSAYLFGVASASGVPELIFRLLLSRAADDPMRFGLRRLMSLTPLCTALCTWLLLLM